MTIGSFSLGLVNVTNSGTLNTAVRRLTERNRNSRER